jgi:hypothetical protein
MADKEKFVPIVRVGGSAPKPKAQPKPAATNVSTKEYGAQRAEQERRDKIVGTLVDAIALEARGEGVPGMALVAKSILNRRKYIREKKDWEGVPVYKNAYLTDGKADLMSILTAKDQYQVMNPDGTPRYDKQNPLTDQDRVNARNALNIALDVEKYAQLAQQEQWPEEAKYITGFRTRTAKDDPSQNVGNFLYGNHIFNTATGTKKPYKK